MTTPGSDVGPSQDRRPFASYTAVPTAAWLELFYDLIFVAAILVFSSAVSHLHDDVRIAWVVGVFVAVWWIWVSTTMFVNRFRFHDVGQRVLVLGQMFFVIVLAVESREGVRRDAPYISVTYACLIGTVAAMYWRAARTRGPLGPYAMRRAGWACASVVIFLVAATVLPAAREILWVLGLLVTIIPAVVHSGRFGGAGSIDERHIVERMGAFTIIVCGEAFLKVAIQIGSAPIAQIDFMALVFQFVLTFAIWSTYFQDMPQAGIHRGRFAPWIALHLLVQLCIAGTAIGVAQMVAVDPLAHLPASDILEVTATLAVMYLGFALLGPCTRRQPARPLFVLRLSTALVIVAVGVAAWKISWIDLVEGVALLSVAALAHTFAADRLRRLTEVSAA
jgi:low temperature requirement protein LtrA